MDPKEYEKRLRKGELYHWVRIAPGYAVIRVDGRCFHKYTNRYEKPFDPVFNQAMVETAGAMAISLGAIYAYVQSDEISLLLPRSWEMFDRELEKTVSVSASMAAAEFQALTDDKVTFDSRVWLGGEVHDVVDYFRWRMADAERNCLNAYAYWVLRNHDHSARAASKVLEHASKGVKHDILMEHGINFNSIQPWQKRGVGIQWGSHQVVGHNPKTDQDVQTTRRHQERVSALPIGDAYDSYLKRVISEQEMGILALEVEPHD